MLTPELTGGTDIISYNVQWDSSTSGVSWSSLAGYTSNFIGDEYQATAEVQAGLTYQIKVRAKNYWGWGEFSDIISIKASTVPDKVDVPVTSIEAETVGVRVNWSAPDNHSDTITAYRIEAQLDSLEWAEICDGTDATIVTN